MKQRKEKEKREKQGTMEERNIMMQTSHINIQYVTHIHSCSSWQQ